MARPYLALGALTVGEQLILDHLKSAPAPLTAQQIAAATGLTHLSGIKDKLHVLTVAGLAEEHGLPGPTATYSAL
jgi:DNA-binding IclR family transcriptional regulator